MIKQLTGDSFYMVNINGWNGSIDFQNEEDLLSQLDLTDDSLSVDCSYLIDEEGNDKEMPENFNREIENLFYNSRASYIEGLEEYRDLIGQPNFN